MTAPPLKAVVLARGLGTRMRRVDDGAELSDAQVRAAERGAKGMIPLGGRPFLDYVLSALADAGYLEACIVVGPEHDEPRARYAGVLSPTRIAVRFAVQERALGTADAVAAAEAFADGDRIAVLNADNYYPVPVLAALRELPGSGLPGFEREALVRESNIPAERVERFAFLTLRADGSLARIIEKPDAATAAALGPDALVSMNLWLFTPVIFDACRRVRPSARGELELADAVRIAIDEMGEQFDVIRVRTGVLDLSTRADVAAVAARLAAVEVLV